jgi:hypothetical protein
MTFEELVVVGNGIADVACVGTKTTANALPTCGTGHLSI